jgi:hypothetical protein
MRHFIFENYFYNFTFYIRIIFFRKDPKKAYKPKALVENNFISIKKFLKNKTIFNSINRQNIKLLKEATAKNGLD